MNDAGGGDFSALDATIGGGTLELDGGNEVLEVEGEWVGVKKVRLLCSFWMYCLLLFV